MQKILAMDITNLASNQPALLGLMLLLKLGEETLLTTQLPRNYFLMALLLPLPKEEAPFVVMGTK